MVEPSYLEFLAGFNIEFIYIGCVDEGARTQQTRDVAMPTQRMCLTWMTYRRNVCPTWRASCCVHLSGLRQPPRSRSGPYHKDEQRHGRLQRRSSPTV